MRLLIAAILAPALLAAPVSAQDHTGHPLFAEGRTLFKDFCSHCHGVDMVNPGTSSFDLRKFPTDAFERFKTSIQKGRGDMPAWGDILTKAEIDALWVYVATRAGKEPYPGDRKAETAVPQGAPELLAEGVLRACMARNGGAMSAWRAGGGAGFDYRVVAAVAGRLGLALEVTWFEAEQDEFAEPVAETYAMLAMGLCDLAPAHPILDGTSGPPPVPRAAPPYWTDRPTDWEIGRQVDLEPVAVTRPYMRTALGVVLGPGAGGREVRALDDLAGLKVGVQQGTLAEAIFRRQAPPEATAGAVTAVPGPKFLWDMETGRFDAALVDVAAYDFHRRQNRITKLRLAEYRHPFGLNIGLAVLARNPGLLARVDAALAELAAEDAFARLAAEEGVTYTPPADGPGDLKKLSGF